MPVTPSYPGVYIEEVPSGVRTIVGVGTSIGMFIGRTTMGELNKPEPCRSYEDFVRKFESSPDSEMATQVQLFFANGGTQCYVTRIAKGAAPAMVTLLNEDNSPQAVLLATAKSAGGFGDSIRISVNYNTLEPEATFNLEVFRWSKDTSGALRKNMVETYSGLSMDPKHPRYAPDIVTQSSNLIKLSDKDAAGNDLAGAIVPTPGFSQSGFAVSARTQDIFRREWRARIGKASTTNRFRISVDNNAPAEVDFSSLDFDAASSATNPNPLNTGTSCRTNLPGRIAELINRELPAGVIVSVTMETGPSGPANQDNTSTVWMRVTSAKGDVKIDPSSDKDLAIPLMLGTAQGGLEISPYSLRRPAPSGWVFNGSVDDLIVFAELEQDAFDAVVIDGVKIDVGNASTHKIATSDPAIIDEPHMYQDAGATSQNDGRGGVREKLAILAAAINQKRAEEPMFQWAAEVWGTRLALTSTAGPDSKMASVTTEVGGAPGPSLWDNPIVNIRYYNLGATLDSPTYFSGGVPGNPGATPGPTEYQAVYPTIDREVDLFNLLILPRDNGISESDRKKLWGPASVFCQKRRAFLLIDPPDNWKDADTAVSASIGVNSLRVGLVKDYSAVFFPNLKVDDGGRERKVGPAGAIAGLMARIDSTRGVWKAPAGTEADLRGVIGIEYRFSDGENGALNPKAVNTIRIFPNGIVAWGARTMDGDDSFGSEYKYIPIRRVALFIEESLYRGLKWVVFEPNDEPLWAQIRLNVGAFMHDLFRQGAFQGLTPRDAYFVKCDKDTTTQTDRNLGIVNILVGFAPLKPAEFVIIKLQQMAGQIQV